MIKLNKHIAIVLLGIFIFPIFFQSIHIAYHNSHRYGNSSGEEGHFDHFESIKNIKVPLLDSEEKCLICEYNFSINNIPEICFFEIHILKADMDYMDAVIHQFKPRILSKKSLRAPPSFLI